MTQDEETKAQYRFVMINIFRITGAVMLVLGLAVIAREAFGLPKAVGYVLFIVGLADFLLVPVFLSKRWKSQPPQ
jgi:spore maturation protein SpmB